MGNPSSALVRVLAVETSSRRGSIALADGDQLLAYRPFDQTRRIGKGIPADYTDYAGFLTKNKSVKSAESVGIRGRDHAVDMLPMLDATLSEFGLRPRDIAQVYVSAGPGSFTGLRIAFTFARAMAFAVGAKLVLVPTVEVLAANAPPDVLHVAVVLDAKRGQVYTAAFSRPAAGEPLRQVYPTQVVAPADMLAATPRPLHVLGEGIDYHRDALPFALPSQGDLIELPREIWPPRADAVLRIGRELAKAGQFTPPHAAIPIYLRRPEAEEVWDRRHPGQGV